MWRLCALLLLSCDLRMHPPGIDACPRVEVEAYTAGERECVLLTSERDTLFRLAASDSCGGPPVLCLHPGETGYALERVRPAAPAEWSVIRGPCAVICP